MDLFCECDNRILRSSLMYDELIGGVLVLTKEQFMRVNGWSNLYWGWGVSVCVRMPDMSRPFCPSHTYSSKMMVSASSGEGNRLPAFDI